MKHVGFTCDSCQTTLGLQEFGREHWTLTYGMVECVTRSIDLCSICKDKIEAALGIKWKSIPESVG